VNGSFIAHIYWAAIPLPILATLGGHHYNCHPWWAYSMFGTICSVLCFGVSTICSASLGWLYLLLFTLLAVSWVALTTVGTIHACFSS